MRPEESAITVFEKILAEYMARVEASETVDRDELLRQHPQFANELKAFFADDERLKRIATPAPSQLDMPTLDSSPARLPDFRFDETFDSRAASPSHAKGATRVGYFGDYELLVEIARGGMGVVYKARQANLNRTVALKMILAGQLASDQDVRRFYQEAEAAANLNHPGIVPIFEIGETDGQHFYSMAYIDGPSLAGLLADGPLPPREAAQIVEQVAEAIAYAHSRGVIHRDLKPANVLLARHEECADTRSKSAVRITSTPQHPERTGFYEPSVTDFGLAKRIEHATELTGTGQILGTPSYMPPEQAAGKTTAVGPAADIYSLGALLYVTLTGRPPFQASNPLDTLMMVLGSEPIAVRQLNPQVPKELETICLKCLQKEPHKRYESAQALADEVNRYLRGEPIHASPVGTFERSWRWCRRKPVLASMASLIGLFVLVLAIGGPLIAIHEASLIRIAAEARSDRNRSQVRELLSASAGTVPVIVENLRADHDALLPELEELLASEETTESQRVRIKLILLENNPAFVDELGRRLIRVDADEFLLLRRFLEPYKESLVPTLWSVALDEDAQSSQRFRAACALAIYDANHRDWQKIRAAVVDWLVSENGLVVAQWVEALRPVSQELIDPLVRVFLDRDQESTPRRILATTILSDYASDDPEVLATLIADSDAQQFASLLPPIESHAHTIRLLLQQRLQDWRAHSDTLSVEASVVSRVANSAVALVRLGHAEAIWPLLGDSQDPRLRTYLIHRFVTHGVPLKTLSPAAMETKDPAIRQALLLAIGEFSESKLTQFEGQSLRTWLTSIYTNDPDAGVHAASQWLIRKCAMKIPTIGDADRAAMPTTLGSPGWLIDSLGQTFVVLSPNEFLMGSQESEFGRREDERQHRRNISRAFGLATQEVTVAEFKEFTSKRVDIDHSYVAQNSPQPDCPQTSVTWFEAAAYCNWLSEQAGVPRSEWCFEANESGQYAAGMRLSPNYLERSGYRLPTEAEWEYACRSGTPTSRFYGDSDSFLDHYAWYLGNALDRSWPVASKKPNRWGLFDMYGNVWEWCVNASDNYPAVDTPVVDQVNESDPIENGQPRSLRGGSYFYHAIYLRSALRNREPVDARYFGIGLRTARTINLDTDKP